MSFHWYQLAIVAVLALLVFGPKRLPEIGSSIGKTIKEFQKSMKEVTGGGEQPPAIPPSANATVPTLQAEAPVTNTTAAPTSNPVGSLTDSETVKP